MGRGRYPVRGRGVDTQVVAVRSLVSAFGESNLWGSHDICANPKLTFGHKRITEGRSTTCKAIVDIGAAESKAVKPGSSCK